jgi:hypothetical protein
MLMCTIILSLKKNYQYHTNARVRHSKIRTYISIVYNIHRTYTHLENTLNIHTRRMLNIFMAKKIVEKNNKSIFSSRFRKGIHELNMESRDRINEKSFRCVSNVLYI